MNNAASRTGPAALFASFPSRLSWWTSCASTSPADKLRGFYRPVLVAWAAEGRVMPPEHGRRLAGMLPNARLVEIPDSYTLDQPTALARALSLLLGATVPPAARRRPAPVSRQRDLAS
jgi:pimeloyl-ACP methyl ester carboxylesterase